MTRRIALIVVLAAGCLLTGCVNARANLRPTHWVTVRDVDTGRPVPDLTLVYFFFARPFFIVGEIRSSRPYRTDRDGRVGIPSGVFLQADTPGWQRVDGPDEATTIYVRRNPADPRLPLPIAPAPSPTGTTSTWAKEP